MSLKTWSGCEQPGQSPQFGQHVQLTTLATSDQYAGLYEAVGQESQAELWRYMPIGPFSALSEFQNTLSFCQSQHGWEMMAIQATNAARTYLGMAGYMRIRATHGSVEVGCVTFSPALQRTPAATEAMYLMAKHVFEDLGYRRYEWKCHDQNQASKRAALRYGFQFEGIFRQDMVVKGENRDTAWFAMIDQDWPRLKAGFETWLAPDNFDRQGLQKSTLEACRT